MKKFKLPRSLLPISGAIALLTLALATMSAFSVNILPSGYLWIAVPLYASVVIVASLITISTKALPRSLASVSAVVVFLAIIINTSSLVINMTASSLIGSIQRTNVSYVEYSVIAKKESAASLDNAASCGLINTDQLYKETTKQLSERANVSIKDYKSIVGIFDGLINSNDIQLAVVRTVSLGIVKDNSNELYEKVKVVGTFKIKSTEPVVEVTDITKPYAVYISGIDAYGSLDSVSRSDVNILVVINPASRKLLLVNTPRDYYVQLHGTSGLKDKLTHAGVYGVDMSRTTMEDLYGISVPYYMRVNFTSLVKVIDTIGPISVYSPYSFKSYQAGYNILDSSRALEFSRERYSFQDGDRQRGRNQQYVIEAIISKMGRLENAVKLPAIVGNLKSSVETNMPEDSLKGVVRGQLDDTRPWTVESISVDGAGAMLPTYSYGNTPLYVMVPDQNSLESAKQQILLNLQ